MMVMVNWWWRRITLCGHTYWTSAICRPPPSFSVRNIYCLSVRTFEVFRDPLLCGRLIWMAPLVLLTAPPETPGESRPSAPTLCRDVLVRSLTHSAIHSLKSRLDLALVHCYEWNQMNHKLDNWKRHKFETLKSLTKYLYKVKIYPPWCRLSFFTGWCRCPVFASFVFIWQ